jgi:ABC-2 type transport system permease protein
MNSDRLEWKLIQHLVQKDWYFMRKPLAAYLGVGAFALFLVSAGSEGTFFAGSVLLFTLLISLGIHLVMATVIQERTHQTLAFVMTLPISPREYTTAKILANLVIFAIPWALLLGGTLAILGLGLNGAGQRLIPFATVMLTEIFLAYCFVLAVALVSESEGWTIAAMVTTNLLFQGVLYWVSHLPGMASTMKGTAVVWNSTSLGLLFTEMALIAALVGVTFRLQSRKTDFI